MGVVGRDEPSAQHEHERHHGAGGDDEPLRPLEVGMRGARPAELLLHPVAQEDPAHRAHRHAAGGEDGHGDDADGEQKILRAHVAEVPIAGWSRSKYTRSMRRRRTRSTCILYAPMFTASPGRGTRPKAS